MATSENDRLPAVSELEPGRGHLATRAREIPWDGWMQILRRVKSEVKTDRLSMVAAGIAFYAFLAVFPAISALVSVWGLLADASQVEEQMVALAGAVPASALELLSESAHAVAETSSEGLSFGLVLSLFLAVWSANKGMKGLTQGILIAYDEEERERSFLGTNLLSLGLTFGAILLALLALGLIIGLPLVFDLLGLGSTSEWLLAIARWPLLAMSVLAALALLYRVSPPRSDPKWRWVTPGSLVATLLWVVGSLAFSTYAQHFSSYDKTYGSLAAVVILLLWLNISAFIFLLGAELNSETEKQTAHDSTTGPPKPMGQRGAVSADTVSGSPDIKSSSPC